MGILRSAAMIGIAKTVFDQAKKPENQAKIRQAVDKAKQQRATRRPGH